MIGMVRILLATSEKYELAEVARIIQERIYDVSPENPSGRS
jgi:hypothetical protein